MTFTVLIWLFLWFLQGSTCTGREIGGFCGSASEDSGLVRHDRRFGGSWCLRLQGMWRSLTLLDCTDLDKWDSGFLRHVSNCLPLDTESRRHETSTVIDVEGCNGKSVPLQAWSCPEGARKLRFPDFMTTAQDGGKFVSLMHRQPLAPWNAPGTHFCQRLSRPQGHSPIGRILCQWKIPMKPATFRFVAQHLNHCATAVPR